MNTQRMVARQTDAALKARAAGSSAPACSAETYRCKGTCRRTGLTMEELSCVAGANNCPYCLGQVVSELTGESRKLPPHPATLPLPPKGVVGQEIEP